MDETPICQEMEEKYILETTGTNTIPVTTAGQEKMLRCNFNSFGRWRKVASVCFAAWCSSPTKNKIGQLVLQSICVELVGYGQMMTVQ